MTEDYAADAAEALQLLSEVGQSVVIQRLSKTRNPVDGSVITDGKLSGDFIGVALKVNARKLAEHIAEDTPAALTRSRIKRLLVAASGALFRPEPNDIAIFDGSNWQVVANEPLNPGGVDLVYDLIVEDTSVPAAQDAAPEVTQLEQSSFEVSTFVNS